MMKKYIALSAFCLMIVFSGMAQRNDLKGPAAKNYKPWKDTRPAKSVTFLAKRDLKGPEAKNQKAWEDTREAYPIASVELRDLKGPEAKNKRPFEKVREEAIAESKKD